MKLTKDYYKLNEVAEIAQVTRRSLYNYLKSGKLTAVKQGGQWRVPKPELELFLRGGK